MSLSRNRVPITQTCYDRKFVEEEKRENIRLRLSSNLFDKAFRNVTRDRYVNIIHFYSYITS